MTVIGVTGKYCAGKNTASEILAESGYAVIDVDSLGHEALKAESARIIERFGAGVDSGGGVVDRKKLGAMVFRDRDSLRDLELIVHPVMVSRVRRIVASHRDSANPPVGVVVNAAVLFRMGLTGLCDRVLYIHARFAVRYRRARERDNAGLFTVLRRLAAQRDVAPQFSGPDADIHSVTNDGSREQLRAKLDVLLSLP